MCELSRKRTLFTFIGVRTQRHFNVLEGNSSEIKDVRQVFAVSRYISRAGPERIDENVVELEKTLVVLDSIRKA